MTRDFLIKTTTLPNGKIAKIFIFDVQEYQRPWGLSHPNSYRPRSASLVLLLIDPTSNVSPTAQLKALADQYIEIPEEAVACILCTKIDLRPDLLQDDGWKVAKQILGARNSKPGSSIAQSLVDPQPKSMSYPSNLIDCF